MLCYVCMYIIYILQPFNFTDILEPPQLIISPMQSPLRVTVGGHLPIYCIAVQGVPIPEVQWHSEGLPVHPLSSFYQQIYVVPTDSPRTITYTCIGTTFSRGIETSELRVNVTVIVEGKLILYGYTLYAVIFKGRASLSLCFLFED